MAERDRKFPKERYEKGVYRKIYVRNRLENWRMQMSYYRGIKQTPENTVKENNSPKAGIYRGVKHDAEVSKKSKTMSQGIYRGTKWEA